MSPDATRCGDPTESTEEISSTIRTWISTCVDRGVRSHETVQWFDETSLTTCGLTVFSNC
jgi:hypothetical protein